MFLLPLAQAGMIPPPDRTMFKPPQNARDSKSSAQLSSMEKLIRFAEKDDWLLYITAMFGILMPIIMYFLYRKAHNAYREYSNVRHKQKKDERIRKRENNKKLEMTIFYSGTSPKTKKLAYEAAERLENVDPLVVKLADTDFAGFQQYKGVCLFVVGLEDEQQPAEITGLFEWLQEARFEHRRRELLSNVAFTVMSTAVDETQLDAGRNIVASFKKNLTEVGAHELCDSVACTLDKLEDFFDVWMTEVRYTAKRIGLLKSVTRRHVRRKPSRHSSDNETETENSFLSDDETDHEKFD